jgi:hypothetical protein
MERFTPDMEKVKALMQAAPSAKAQTKADDLSKPGEPSKPAHSGFGLNLTLEPMEEKKP